MRMLPLPWAAAILLAGALNASAGPSPDQDQDREPRTYEESENTKFLSLFDSAGLPMLQVSAPTYLQLGERKKLRAQGPGFDDPGGGGGGGGGSDDGGGGGDDDGGGDNKPPRPVPEPASLLMLAPAAAVAIRKYGRGRASRS